MFTQSLSLSMSSLFHGVGYGYYSNYIALYHRVPPQPLSSPLVHYSTLVTERRHRRNANTASSSSTTRRKDRPWYYNFIHNYQRNYERYKLWGIFLGIFTIGSITKAAFFYFSRQLRIYMLCSKKIVYYISSYSNHFFFSFSLIDVE